MILVVVAKSIVEIDISLEVFSEVERNLADARLHIVIFNVLGTCGVAWVIIFNAICIVYHMLFHLKN